jgi:hypothetical protein
VPALWRARDKLAVAFIEQTAIINRLFSK